MRCIQSLLCLVILSTTLSGCDGFVLFVSTGPLPAQRQSPTSPLPPATVIVVGDVVHSTFVVPQVCFDVRAPATGILFVRLSWDPREGDIDVAFASSVFATEATAVTSVAQTSAVRSLRVTRGETYRIEVVGNHGPVPFMLTTSLE
jgi:hypothetical protein